MYLKIKKIIPFSCNTKVRLAVPAIIAILLLFLSGMISFADRINNDLSQRLVRLHIIANSDTASDQSLKLEVRDAMLNIMQDQARSLKNKDEVEAYIKGNLKVFESAALKVIHGRGKNYPVKAGYSVSAFPTKDYGDISLPAGYYDALRIEIGEAEGQNWWCVMFPPLCFVDATHGEIPDNFKENLKENLTEEEYLLITSTDNPEDIPVKVKFKIVEIFQDSKIRFAGLFNKKILHK